MNIILGSFFSFIFLLTLGDTIYRMMRKNMSISGQEIKADKTPVMYSVEVIWRILVLCGMLALAIYAYLSG